MKVYTLGRRGYAHPTLADLLDVHTEHRQVTVLIAARTKAEAFMLLAARHLAPTSIRDRDFRQATGTDVDVLRAGGVFDYPIVVMRSISLAGGPVVRVDEGKGQGAIIGHIIGGGWQPEAADMVAAAERAVRAIRARAVVGADDEEKQRLLAALAGSVIKIRAASDQLARARDRQRTLAQRAREMNLIKQAAAELGVTPQRVGQLADEALAIRAGRGGVWPPGTPVQVTDPAWDPVDFLTGVVVEKPRGKSAPSSDERWVWVRYDLHGGVAAVRAGRLVKRSDAEFAETCSRSGQITVPEVLAVVEPRISEVVGYIDDDVLRVEPSGESGGIFLWVGECWPHAEQALSAAGYRVRVDYGLARGALLEVTR